MKKEVTLKQRIADAKKEISKKDIDGFLFVGFQKLKGKDEYKVNMTTHLSGAQALETFKYLKEQHPELFLRAMLS